jgi:RNA polymerase sigma-70 factor (ECF subfamily)
MMPMSGSSEMNGAPGGSWYGSPDEEQRLVARLRRGDGEAFEELVREQGGRLLLVARRFLRNEEDARDAVQEAFLSAFRSLDDFAGNCRLSTWIHRILINAALMKLRSRRRKAEESIEDLLPRFDETGHQVNHPTPEWQDTADGLLERRETRELVRTAIDRLPETYRSVLLLRDIEELSTEEAAMLLGVTANAVKIRLHRARQALRTLLEPSFRRVALC